MRRWLFAAVFSAALCVGDAAYAQLRTFLSDPQVLESIHAAVRSGAHDYAPAVKGLRKEAEKMLALAPPSVVEKKMVPQSGSKHDYMSMGKYWWPDPASKDGRPYIRRDGEVNPEAADRSDEARLNTMIKAVSTLAYASYYLGEKRYADRAVKLLRVWFLDSLTRMAPNLDYAQAVPGRNDGRGSGIIDAHQLPLLIDALGVLSASASYTPADREGMLAWFREYLRWLRESKNGKQEAKAANNHGSWYDVQVVAAALFVGDDALARTVLTGSKEARIGSQIEPDGTMPKELARTRSFGYSMFNLKALVDLALLGERTGVDLWHFETKDGRSIRRALDYLLPYMSGTKAWEGKQIAEVKVSDMYPLLLEASRVYRDPQYADAASHFPDAKKYSQTSLLLQGRR